MKFVTERFWTSGYLKNCKINPYWCSAKQTIYKGIFWKLGEPNNNGGVEWAVDIMMNTGAVALSEINDSLESLLMKAICEVSFVCLLIYVYIRRCD